MDEAAGNPAPAAERGALRRRAVHTDLMLPMVLLLAALAVGAFWEAREGGREAREEATQDAAFGAQLGATAISEAIDVGQQTLAQLAASPGLSTVFSGPGTCELTFSELGPFTSGHLDVISPAGEVGCSSLEPTAGTAPYAGASWLRGDLDVVVPVRDERTGRTVAVLSRRIPGEGIVAVFLDLDAAGASLSSRFGGRRGLEFLVTAPDGEAILTRSVEPDRWVGRRLDETAFSLPSRGAEGRDVTGARRFYGTATVDATDWIVHAGADQAQALVSADRHRDRQLWILAAGLATLLAAALVINRRLTRPIRHLSQQVRAASGNPRPGPVDVNGPLEVADLAVGFNRLLSSVEQQLLALRASEARKVSMLESSLDCVITMDHDGRLVDFNHAAETTFGYRAEDVVGQDMAELLMPSASRDAHRAGLDLYLRTGEAPILGRRIDVTAMRSDGTEFACELTVNRVDASGDALFTGYLRDVTDRLQGEERRQALERRLNQSHRLESLGQLAGGVAHDFNNLLQVIMAYTTFIAKRASDDETIREDVAQIRIATDRAALLTRQLLIFGRRDPVMPQVLDVNAVVADVNALLARSIGEHVAVSVHAHPDLPPVLLDRGHLEQVLVNLVVNARDAMPDGGRITIETTTTDVVDEAYVTTRPDLDAGQYVELSVSDTGVGMTSEMAAHAFDPFFSTKPRDEGSGLGLATVYGIVTEAGGEVTIYTEEGVGTTVRVLLPAAAAQKVDDVLPRLVVDDPGGHGEAILVVEDEPATREATVRILRHAGYTAVGADGATEALELAGRRQFALLVTDVVMPGLPGRALATLMTERYPTIATVFMSGYTEGALGAQSALDNGVRLLQKPFTDQQLLSAVREALT